MIYCYALVRSIKVSIFYQKIGDFIMQDVKTYLSTAPVLAALWFGILAGLLIEINRFFPDALVLPFI
jgi:photosystem I subunit IX